MALHKNLGPVDAHVPYAFTYASASARTGATGLVASDIGKFARQTDTNTIWMLTNNSPVTWVAVTGGAADLSIYTLKLDYLLQNDPEEQYDFTTSGGLVTSEQWAVGGTTLVKKINYTYTGSLIDTEIRKVYAANGTTVSAQLTITYVYSGGVLTGATQTRNV